MIATEPIKKALKDAKTDMQIAVFNVFFDNAKIIEEMNRDQLRAGFRADGLPLPNYSEASIRYFGKPRGRIKLFETGAFYRGFKLDADPDESFLLGTEEKTEMLENRYGSEIIGLSEENKNKFKIQYLKPGIIQELKKYFNDRQ